LRRETPIGWPRVRAKKENLMADFSCLSTKRSSDYSPSMSWKAPMRFRVILAVAAFALAGCNANQEVNLSSQAAPGVVSDPNFPDYNPYNPVTYAQTSGLYGGGQNYHGAGR
jgi:hypothetical protein